MMTRQVNLAIAACLVIAMVIPALAEGPAQAPARAPRNGSTPQDAEYKIGPADILTISVWKNDSMSRTVPVRPDGRISLPLLNDVQAAGLTPPELRSTLVKKLEEYMPTPEVAVIVGEVKSFKVSVLGEVTKPGRFELKGPATVLDMLAEAGGFKDFASRTKIVILRNENGAAKRIAFNYNKVVSGSDQDNFFVQPGDIVLVP